MAPKLYQRCTNTMPTQAQLPAVPKLHKYHATLNPGYSDIGTTQIPCQAKARCLMYQCYTNTMPKLAQLKLAYILSNEPTSPRPANFGTPLA